MWLLVLSESVCHCSFAKVANAHGSAVAMRKDFSITRFLTTSPVEDINKEAIARRSASEEVNQAPDIGRFMREAFRSLQFDIFAGSVSSKIASGRTCVEQARIFHYIRRIFASQRRRVARGEDARECFIF